MYISRYMSNEGVFTFASWSNYRRIGERERNIRRTRKKMTTMMTKKRERERRTTRERGKLFLVGQTLFLLLSHCSIQILTEYTIDF